MDPRGFDPSEISRSRLSPKGKESEYVIDSNSACNYSIYVIDLV